MDRFRRRLALVVAAAAVAGTGCGRPAPGGPAAARTAAAGGPPPARTPAQPPPARTPPARPGSPREISFDDIKLDLEKGAPFHREVLPGRVTDLAGTTIRIRGYILPSFQQTGLKQFVLVRDNQECCFGPGAALHDCIVVRMRGEKSADFSIRPVAVAGTFRIDELRGPDGKHLAIYALDGDEVK